MNLSEIQLTPRKFEYLCSLEYSLATCAMISWPQREQMECLVVEFSGECGKGTCNSRTGYAEFMSAIVKAAVEAWKPVALILDLRQLKYEWGDEMNGLFYACDSFQPGPLTLRSIFGVYPDLAESELSKMTKESLSFPTAVIVSELNRTGMTSLVKDEMGKSPDDLLFETLEDALAAVDRQAQRIFKKP